MSIMNVLVDVHLCRAKQHDIDEECHIRVASSGEHLVFVLLS